MANFDESSTVVIDDNECVIEEEIDVNKPENSPINKETNLEEAGPNPAKKRNKSKKTHKKKKSNESSSSSSSSSDSESELKAAAVRGRNKSGRFWKGEKKRFRSMIKTPGLNKTTVERRLALRAELKHAKELTRTTVNKRIEEKEAKKERRRENMRRAEVNRKKAEIVQVIKNSSKIKKMKKKQLRYIEKRDTTNIK